MQRPNLGRLLWFLPLQPKGRRPHSSKLPRPNLGRPLQFRQQGLMLVMEPLLPQPNGRRLHSSTLRVQS